MLLLIEYIFLVCGLCACFFFFFKQKTAYEMRISDWSSDVCLPICVAPERLVFAGRSDGEAYFQAFREVDLMLDAWPAPGSTTTLDALSNGVPEIGRASGRERVCQYV